MGVKSGRKGERCNGFYGFCVNYPYTVAATVAAVSFKKWQFSVLLQLLQQFRRRKGPPQSPNCTALQFGKPGGCPLFTFCCNSCNTYNYFIEKFIYMTSPLRWPSPPLAENPQKTQSILVQPSSTTLAALLQHLGAFYLQVKNSNKSNRFNPPKKSLLSPKIELTAPTIKPITYFLGVFCGTGKTLTPVYTVAANRLK